MMRIPPIAIMALMIGVQPFILFCLAAGAHGAAEGHRWRSIPLTTPAQKEAGVAGGEGFQQVMCILYAPSEPAVVYMGSDTTKVWKSTDAGRSWRVASEGMDSNGACSLLVHPATSEIVIAAGCLGPEAERAHLGKGRREGIFRTVDGGTSWTFVHKTEFHKQRSMGSLFAADLRTLGRKELTLYAGSYADGLLVSKDTGQTWQKTAFNKGTIRDIEVFPAEPGTLAVATSMGLYSYRDGLVKQIGRGLAGAPSSIAISPAAPERVIAVAEGAPYVSDDKGLSFQPSSRGLPPALLSRVVDVYASPIDPLRLYAGTWKSRLKGPYCSDDGGNSWQKAETMNARGLTDGGGFWFPSPVAPHPRRPLVALAASNGRTRILRTENGGRTWEYSGSGFTGGRVVDMAFASPEEWYLALTDHGLWRTTDGGRSFENIEIPGAHPRSAGAVAVSGKTIALSVGGWREKQVTISHDQGRSWRMIDSISDEMNHIRFHPQKPNIIYASGYRSDDRGNSWVHLQHKVGAIFPINGDVVFGFDETSSQVVESNDMGATWHTLACCLGSNIGVNEIAADPNVRGRLYLGSSTGLYRVEGGQCERIGPEAGFTRDTHGSLAVKSVAVDPASPHIVYAGRWAPGMGVSAGIYRSEDFGRTWAPFNHGISGSFDAWSLETGPRDGAIYSGTTFGLHMLEGPAGGKITCTIRKQHLSPEGPRRRPERECRSLPARTGPFQGLGSRQ